MASAWVGQFGSTMPYGERVSRAGCLFSVSKTADEIPKHIQHSVPVSGPLLPSLTTNCFVQKRFENAAALLAGTYLRPDHFSDLHLVGGHGLVRGLSSQMTYCEGLFNSIPFLLCLCILGLILAIS